MHGNKVLAVYVFPAKVKIAQGESQQFSARVQNDKTNSVTWSIQPPNGAGTVDETGMYRPPIEGKGTAKVIATSRADSKKSGEAEVSF